MHDTAYDLARLFFSHFIGNKPSRVLELGSLDVNGSLRDFASPEVNFTGVDMTPGKSVDIVLEDPHRLPFADNSFDFVVSSSCFEHDKFFWLSFLEMVRVTRAGGYLYINTPSNGVYHAYPIDCWRFYPDSAQALSQWADKNNIPVSLIESFTANRKNDIWNDHVMVFNKGKIVDYSGPFLSDIYGDVHNLRKFPNHELLKPMRTTEDMAIIEKHRASLDLHQQSRDETNTRLKELALTQSQSQSAIEGIAAAQSQSQSAIERIATAQSQSQGAIEGIAAAQSQSHGAIERIAAAQSQSQSDIERIAAAQSQSQSALGRMAIAQSQFHSSVDKIAVAQSKVELAVQDIATAQSQSQNAIGEVRATQAEQQNGLKDILRKIEQLTQLCEPRVPLPSSFDNLIYKLIPERLRKQLRTIKLNRDIRYLQQSHLFNPSWYLSRYPDVSLAGMDAAAHFVLHGEEEGRQPSPDFRTDRPKMLAYHQLAFTGSYFVKYLKVIQSHSGYLHAAEIPRASPDLKDRPIDLHKLFEGHQAHPYTEPDKMEVLFIGHDASATGAPILFLGMIRQLIQSHRINCRIVLQAGGTMAEEYKKVGPTLLLPAVNEKTGSLEKSAELLSDYFAQVAGPKLVLANTAAVDNSFCRVFTQKQVPYLCWIHEMPDCIERHFGGRGKMEYLSKRAAALIFVGPLNYQENLKRFGLRKDNAHIIGSGVTLQPDKLESEVIRSSVRHEFHIPQDACLVLGCGTVENRKGPDLFIQVAKLFLDLPQAKGLNVHFLWIGQIVSREYHDSLKAAISAANLQNRVHFVGARKNPHTYFKASDVFLMTSRSDSRPLVVFEAIGYKLPVIAFENATGASEYISKGYGSLVSYLDADAMAKELLDYLLKGKTIKDDGDRFIEEELSPALFSTQFYREFARAVYNHKPIADKKVLVISGGCPPLCGHVAEGGGLRCWGLARSIKRLLPDHEVTLCYLYKLESKIADGYYDDVFVTEFSHDVIRGQIKNFSTVIVSYCMGEISRQVAEWLSPGQQLILDCYVPIYVEISARNSVQVQQEYDNLMLDIPRLNQSLQRGDCFLCANDPQRIFYGGVLSALGRINPKTYRDSGLRIVPYGIDSLEPTPKNRPIKKLLGNDHSTSWKLLWFGAVYPWFNIKILLDSIRLLNQLHPTHLVMVGIKNPFNQHPDFIEKAKEIYSLISQPEFKDLVSAHDWVPYEDRADWYLDCDLIITLNEPGMENGLSWRTRVADYVWAGMPVATNGGDPLSEDLIAHEAAGRLDITSVKSLTETIYQLLADESRLAQMKVQMRNYRPKLHWDNVIKPLVEIIEHRSLAADRL